MSLQNPSHRGLRLPGYDYALEGAYFVTFNTSRRQRLLGDIRQGVVHLSPAGAIVAEELRRSPDVRPSIALDAFVVMPDHVHVIIVIREYAASRRTSGTFQSPSRTLGAVVRAVKATATRRICRECPGIPVPIWQTLYHERIIRDEAMLNRVRRYIELNPSRWNK
jgi:putative transposase